MECKPIQTGMVDFVSSVKILTVKIDGNSLIADISRAADEIPIHLYWNGSFMKSLPPKVTLQMGNADMVRKEDQKMVEETVCFDITGIREKTAKQGVVILLGGFEKPIHIPAEK